MVSPGDASGRQERKSRAIARKRWRFIPLLTATRDVGGTLGKLWKYAMGSPGRGKGGVLSGYLLQHSRVGALSSTMQGTIAAVRIAEDPATVAPIHTRLAKSGGGPRFKFYLFPRVWREAARRGWGEAGGRPMVALMCLSRFASLRVAEAASVRVEDIWGEKALGFWATKRGIIGWRWWRWSEWSKAPGEYKRKYTKGWEGDEQVVLGGPPVFESAMARFLQGTEWEDGGWHGHCTGGGRGRAAHRKCGSYRSGGRRISARPWRMPRISKIGGCWVTSSCRGPGTGTPWSSGTWRQAKCGQGCSLSPRGWAGEGGDVACREILTRMTLGHEQECRKND